MRVRVFWFWPYQIFLGVLCLGAWIAASRAPPEFDLFTLLAFRQPDNLSAPIGPSWLPGAALFVTNLGGSVARWSVAAAAVLVLCSKRLYRLAACVVAAVCGAALLEVALKAVFHRSRPALVPHLVDATSYAFPSGHALVSAALYATIAMVVIRFQTRLPYRCMTATAAILLVGLIGVSRVYLGVHWSSDVAAGWALGLAWALFVLGAEKALGHREKSSAPA